MSVKYFWLLIRLGCITVSAVAPLAVLYYFLFGVFEAQSGASAQSGLRWASALQVAVPAAAVELGITMVVLLFAKAMSTNPASRSAHVVAVAMAALCASVPTSFFLGLVAWPVVLLSCVVPAGLAAPALMRSAAATTPPA
ncbi:hypothetical protein OG568_50845 (plasmid) [Streptomyces sp. NBC_01450]|uniref:hypothetical protein n=1 Tax=Streptomyces sp. NBC_01450 TaxID=2903871 RepID=UPI002E2EADBE|nr:hypothetical protein [Streptomyces sp. NBC_01450]